MRPLRSPARPGPGHAAGSSPARAVSRSRWLGVVTGVVAGVMFAVAAWNSALPPPAAPLRLNLEFPTGLPGDNEPLITTGRFGNGDFLTVKYRSHETAVLSYDAWGRGGPASPPFPLEPGVKRTLQVEMPSLAPEPAPAAGDERELRVTLDGREVLHERVYFHRRQPAELYLAENPIGGSPAGRFRGRITTPGGVRLRGRPAALFTAGERVSFLVRTRGWQLLLAAAACLGVGLVVARLPVLRWIAAVRGMAPRRLAARTTAPHGTAVLVALACVALYATLITGGTFRVLYPESFANFFDYQAASLLQGRLDVPESALSGEAFVVHGRYYGYFGITPSLLRLPFVAAPAAFGQLSRAYMIGYHAACLAAAYALLCWATRRLCGPAAWPSRWAAGLLLAATGLGSTLFFLGSRAYIYHEAILCGAAFALWSAYFSLRYLEEPGRRWWCGAALGGFLAVHARPPAGLFSLFLLGIVSAHHLVAAWRAGGWRKRSLHAAVGLAATLAMASFSGLSYLKFGTFDGSPLHYSVQYTPDRVARFEGKNFHASNLRHNLDRYLVGPSLRLERKFPYVFFGATGRSYPEARIDLDESTVPIPFAMAGLFALALAGGGWAVVSGSALRRPVRLLAVGVTPMSLALFTAIVTSHRYTGDFCAFLVAAAACGLAALDTETAPWRRPALAAGTALTLVAIVVTVSLSLTFQGELVWGVAPGIQHRFQALRHHADAWLGIVPP